MGIISFRKYVLIAVIVAVAVFILGAAFGNGIASGLEQLKVAAMRAGMASTIASVVIEPLKAAFTGGIIGAILAGIMWPFAALWLFFVFLMFFFAALGSGFNQAANTIRS